MTRPGQPTPLPQTEEDLRGRTPAELAQLVDALADHLRGLHQGETGELRHLEADQQAEFDTLFAVHERAVQMLEEHRRVADALARRPQAATRIAGAASTDQRGDLGEVTRMSVAAARDEALRLLESADARSELSADQLHHVERQIRRDTHIARRALITEHPDYRAAFVKVMTDPHGAALLEESERDALRAWAEFRAMAEGAGSTGGYGVPVFIDPSIILTAQGSSNPFLSLATQKTITTNAWKGVSSAGVSWSFDAEASAVSDDSPTLAQPQVDIFTARGFLPFSLEVGQDYPSFAEEMSVLLAAGYDELLVDKFSRGSGTGEPRGILTALDADTTAEVLLTTAGALGSVDIYRAWEALPQRFRRSASWMMSVSVMDAIRQLGSYNNSHAFTANLTAGQIDVLFNRGVYESPYFPNAVSGTAHQNQLVVGDFSNYVVARRGGMSVELVAHLVDVTNNRPTGQRGWFAWARIGGNVASTAGFKLLNQT